MKRACFGCRLWMWLPAKATQRCAQPLANATAGEMAHLGCLGMAGRRMSVSGAGMLALYTKKLSLAESFNAIVDTARSLLIAALDALEHHANGVILKDGVDYRVPLRAARASAP